MDVWQMVGAMGVLVTSAQLLPQLYKSLKTRQVRDLSMGLCILVGSSAMIWTLYGIHLRDAPLIVANTINLIGAIILFVLKIKDRV